MLQLSKITPDSESHEEVFLGRYTKLRAWAIQLTDGDRERAEDLVHDVYILFNLTRPDLNAILNLDGYLYRMLRNLHLSQLRRSLRQQHGKLSIIDYDSAEIGLRAADPRQQIRLQDELRQICQYACARKETSKAGSVLILRFLHGYHPREIAQVMLSTRSAVEERLRVAREEARQYLNNPKSLHFMRGSNTLKIRTEMGFSRTTDELLNELRQTIFNSRQGSCLPRGDLKKLYAGSEVTGLDRVTLGHIASCPDCLDEVNHLLNLPLLVERSPTDTIGTDKGAKGGGGGTTGGTSGGGAFGSELRQLRRRAKDVFEHRPTELRVSVNGYLVSAQNVGSELSEQTLSINVAEKIEFIEIFGEQDIRLLFLTVEEPPPGGSFRQSVRIELSDERNLEATLSFSNPWPTLQLLYSDPLTSAEVAAQTDQMRKVGARSESEKPATVLQPDPASKRATPQDILIQTWRWLINSGFWLRPATITSVLSLILIAALLFVRMRVPTVSAADLLHRSTVAAETIAGNPEVVLHRTISLEEREPKAGNVIARWRLETWQSAAQGIKLRRMYDGQNNLIAGEWSKADGSSTVYRRGMKPQARTAPEVATKAILETGEVWRLDASARDFDAVVGGGEPIAVEERLDTYVLTYQSGASNGQSKLLRATLTLNKTDLHAIEQTLTLQRDGDMREFRFIEAGFVRNSTESVAPGVFQPDSELLGITEGPKSGSGNAPATDDFLHNEAAARPGEAVASGELEIEVTYLLAGIKANLGEQVSITRTTGGPLRVEALVETERRKEEILRALRPVINNPAVKIEVRTVAEAVRRGPKDRKSAEITVREVEVASGRIPADLELRKYFSARLVGNEAIDEEIRRYAGRSMSHSRQALLQASALKRLVERFSPDEMSALSPEARSRWLGMIQDHAQSYLREVAAMRRELRPIFYRSGGTPEDATNGASPARMAERLVQLSYANDDAVRSAFTISADGRTSAAIKSEQFWRSLSTAEKLAGEFRSVSKKGK